MDLEIYIHGASKGHQIWPSEARDHYVNRFYIPANDETKFLVELRNGQDGKSFCYYSYLKYKNIVGGDGREGSYVGITIRLDYYYIDVVSVYNILDVIYKKHIVGTLLVQDKGFSKYLTTDFQIKDKELTEAMKSLTSLLQLSMVNTDFVNISSLHANNDGTLPEINLLDCTKENILSVMRKCSKVAISPYYPTVKDKNSQKIVKEQMAAYEKTKENEIEGLKNSLQQQINQSTIEKNSLQQKVDELTAAKEKLTASVSSLEKERQSLQGKLQASEERKNASELVVSLREPLTKLAKIVGNSEENHHSHRYENSEHEYNSHESKTSKLKDFFFPILHTVLLVIIVVYCSFRTYSEVVNKEPKAVETEIQRASANDEEPVDTMIVSPTMNMHKEGMSN